MKKLEEIPEENRNYLDEAGSHLAMTPSYARAPKGQRAIDSKPVSRGGNLSLAGVMNIHGMRTLHAYDGAMCSDKFIHFAENYLVKTWKPHDVLIMDNLRVHHAKKVRLCLERLKIRVLFLPPYSPELNPIEEGWSLIKNAFRRKKARDLVSYVEGMQEAKALITEEKSRGFFRHSERNQNLQ